MAQPPPELTAEAAKLVVAEEAARLKLELQAAALVTRAVRMFDLWYDSTAITKWAKDVTRGVETLQRLLARTTDAYLGRSASLVSGRRVRPVGAIDVSALRRGITHEGAFGRVADAYRWQASRVAEPVKLRTPLDAAVERAKAVASIDMRQAVQHQSRKFMETQTEITGYRRVIHPELSKGGTCGLCIAASDRLYGPTELMPVHDHCNCLPLPVYDDKDLGSALNEGDLRRLYQEAGNSTSREKLKRTRYRIEEHAELGPILVPADAKVRTESDVKRDQRS